MIRCLIVGVLLTLCGWVIADEDEAQSRAGKRGLSVGGGPVAVMFDSNFKITDMSKGKSVFVDTEGTFGLPETYNSAMLLLSYRFSSKHGMAFSYFDVRRERVILDGEADIGDYTAYGDITIKDASNFYTLNYSYTIFEDDRSFVSATMGLFGLDLGLSLEASGGIRSDDEELSQVSVEDSLGFFAPLPLFGLDFWWSYSDRWGIGTKVALVAGSYDDVSAGVVDTTIRARYKLSTHFDLFFGLKYFFADVKVSEDEYKNDIAYGMNGVFMGINYRL